MNDGQVDGLNNSTYWRDRSEKESQEKRVESKKMMREILKWWAERDRWETFTKSYPNRFAHLLHKASILGKVVYIPETGLFCFQTDDGNVEFGVYITDMPDWPVKDAFENLEKIFVG
jgi:hypothetical protein